MNPQEDPLSPTPHLAVPPPDDVDEALSQRVQVGGHGGGKFVFLQLIVDAEIIAAGILLSLLMGLLGGLLPALTAMRLKPLDALK